MYHDGAWVPGGIATCRVNRIGGDCLSTRLSVVAPDAARMEAGFFVMLATVGAVSAAELTRWRFRRRILIRPFLDMEGNDTP